MEEVIKLLSLLGVAVVGNILGGVYVNLNINHIEFNYKKLLGGLIKAACICFMFLAVAFILDNIPSLVETTGVQPKVMIVSAIAIYTTKIVAHLTSIFGFKKEQTVAKKEEENILEYEDM